MTYRPLAPGQRILGIIILLAAFGLAWVWRSGLFNSVAAQSLKLEKEATVLVDQSAHLRQELLRVSEYARVESIARNQLKMVFPSVPPETLEVKGSVESPLLGTMTFFPLAGNGQKHSKLRR